MRLPLQPDNLFVSLLQRFPETINLRIHTRNISIPLFILCLRTGIGVIVVVTHFANFASATLSQLRNQIKLNPSQNVVDHRLKLTFVALRSRSCYVITMMIAFRG